MGFAPDPPLAPPALTGVEWLSYLAAHRARGPAQRLARLREAGLVVASRRDADARFLYYERDEAAVARARAAICEVLR